MSESPRVAMVDFETRSYLDVRKVGAWRYAEDPTTEILCLGYRIGDGPRNLWTPNNPFPDDLLAHIEAGGTFEAHNVQFERAIWLHLLLTGRWAEAHGGRPEDNVIPMPTRWRDTLAVCAYRALPLALDKAGAALRLPIQKDPRGKYLIQTLCTPKWGTKANPDRIYREDEDLTLELYDYCLDDVDAEGMLGDTLGYLPPSEHRVWVLDQVINQRGVRLDREAAEAALRLTQHVQTMFNNELSEITGGSVSAATERDKIINWLRDQDVLLPDLRAETVADTLADADRMGLPDGPRRVLELRAMLAKSSTKKLEKMLETVCADGNMRGLLQYYGASTGRWAGRLAQPQNMPRGKLEKYASDLGMKGRESEIMELLIETISLADLDPETARVAVECSFGDPMQAVATALRGMFVSEDGTVFMVSDFSAIEAVVTAWVAGEEWKLEAFRAIQRKEKYNGADDIYCAAAAKIFQRVITKADNPEERGVGKVCELAFGYQGSVGAWRNFDRSDTYTDEQVAGFCKDWRLSHPAIAGRWLTRENGRGYFAGGLWRGLQGAAKETVRTGKPHGYSCVTYDIVEDAAGKWLTCRLPNGRLLWYYDPVLEVETVTSWEGDHTYERESLTYMGRDNKRGGVWGRIRSYGGMLTENVVQAISRDLMVEAMIRVERAGYKIILTVHDEIVAQVPVGFGSMEEFNALMSIVPEWARGCPIGVAGWTGPRYMKG